MYREKFVQYLHNFSYSNSMKEPIEYLLKNEQASYTRAALTLAWCEECGGSIEKALPLALAVESLHTSSLIQDDLPCMDNAQERRNAIATHLKFDESTAILTSDILINLAYTQIIMSDLTNDTKCKAIEILTTLFFELCEGQYKDLHHQEFSVYDYLNVNRMKTGSLIKLACAFGAIAAEGTETQIQNAIHFGELIGLGYQIKDDLKDNDGILNIIDSDAAIKIIHNANVILPHYKNKYLEQVRSHVLC